MRELPSTYSVGEVAEALNYTPRYVQEQCRLRKWPHLRGPRGQVSFTAEQYQQVLDLCAAPIESVPEPRLAWAPRSRRSA